MEERRQEHRPAGWAVRGSRGHGAFGASPLPASAAWGVGGAGTCARPMRDLPETPDAVGAAGARHECRRKNRRMSAKVSERAFEDAIEAALLRYGPERDPRPFRVRSPRRRRRTVTRTCGRAAIGDGGSEDYDRALCLLPRDVLDFVQATQPKEWQRLSQHHGGRGAGAIPEAPLVRDRAARDARSPPARAQGHGLLVPARVLPPRERTQRGGAAAPRGQLLRGCPPGPIQHQEREEPRPRALPEWDTHLHGRAQEPPHRPDRRGRDPAVQDGP